MVEKFRRVDWYPDDWLSGTTELSLEEEGAYGRICMLIYSKGRPIPDNDRWLASSCRVSTRKWRTLRRALIDKGKITVSDGMIHQERCEKELEKAATSARKQAESGAKGGRKRAENALKTSRKRDENIWEPAEPDANHLENNNQGQARLKRASSPRARLPSPSPSPTTSKNDDYAFDGVVIRLNWRDYTKWSEAFRAIPDLRASLQNRDDWLATRPESEQLSWFISTSNYLAKQNAGALAEQVGGQDDEYDPDFIN